MVGSGPGELGDRITVADLELPGDLGTSQNQFAVHMTAIGDLVIDDGERPRSADRGRGRKGPLKSTSICLCVRPGAGGVVPTDMIADYNHLLVEYKDYGRGYG